MSEVWLSSDTGEICNEFREWKAIEFDFTAESARLFWAMTLYFAFCDSAESLRFSPALGESCLSTVVDGTVYEMIPPPVEFREWLWKSAREILAGDALRGITRRAIAVVTGRPLVGTITFRFGALEVLWSGRCAAFSHPVSLEIFRASSRIRRGTEG